MECDYAVSVGELLESILMSMNKTKKWLSKKSKLSINKINDIINGNIIITLPISILLEKATSIKSADWLAFQQAFINKNNLFDRIEKLFVLRKGEE